MCIDVWHCWWGKKTGTELKSIRNENKHSSWLDSFQICDNMKMYKRCKIIFSFKKVNKELRQALQTKVKPISFLSWIIIICGYYPRDKFGTCICVSAYAFILKYTFTLIQHSHLATHPRTRTLRHISYMFIRLMCHSKRLSRNSSKIGKLFVSSIHPYGNSLTTYCFIESNCLKFFWRNRDILRVDPQETWRSYMYMIWWAACRLWSCLCYSVSTLCLF